MSEVGVASEKDPSIDSAESGASEGWVGVDNGLSSFLSGCRRLQVVSESRPTSSLGTSTMDTSIEEHPLVGRASRACSLPGFGTPRLLRSDRGEPFPSFLLPFPSLSSGVRGEANVRGSTSLLCPPPFPPFHSVPVDFGDLVSDRKQRGKRRERNQFPNHEYASKTSWKDGARSNHRFASAKWKPG